MDLFQKAEIDIDDKLREAIEKSGEIELPDSATELTSKLLTEKAAKANKSIEKYFEDKVNKALTSLQVQKLKDLGFDDSQVKEISQLAPADRIAHIIEIQRQLSGVTTNATIDEVEKRYKKIEEELRAKLSAKDQALLEREKHYNAKVEEARNDSEFSSFLSTFNFRKDGLPKERTYALVKEDVNKFVSSIGGVLYFINGNPKLMRANDPTMELYDDNNNLIDAKQLIYKIADGLNVLEKNVNPPKQPARFTGAQVKTNVDSGNHVQSQAKNRVNDLINKIRNSR